MAYSIYIQKKEIKEIKDEMKKQKFDNNFFQMIELLNNVIDNLEVEKVSKKEVFAHLYKVFSKTIQEAIDNKTDFNKIINSNFEKKLKKNIGEYITQDKEEKINKEIIERVTLRIAKQNNKDITIDKSIFNKENGELFTLIQILFIKKFHYVVLNSIAYNYGLQRNIKYKIFDYCKQSISKILNFSNIEAENTTIRQQLCKILEEIISTIIHNYDFNDVEKFKGIIITNFLDKLLEHKSLDIRSFEPKRDESSFDNYFKPPLENAKEYIEQLDGNRTNQIRDYIAIKQMTENIIKEITDYDILKHIDKREFEKIIKKSYKEIFQEEYKKFTQEYDTTLKYFFINLFQILKYIDKQDIDEPMKKSYMNIVRAKLPKDALILLFYNGIDAINHKYKEYIEDYELLEHLNIEHVRKPYNNDKITEFNKIMLSFYKSEEISKDRHKTFGENSNLRQFAQI